MAKITFPFHFRGFDRTTRTTPGKEGKITVCKKYSKGMVSYYWKYIYLEFELWVPF